MSRLKTLARKPLSIITSALFVLIALFFITFHVASNNTQSVYAQTTPFYCGVNNVPLGALPGQPEPTWCRTLTTGPSTFVSGTNSWIDEFNHGLSFADLGTGYKQFSVGSFYKTQQWRHNNHWMVDTSGLTPAGEGNPYWNQVWAFTRPDRSFTFEDRGDGRGKTLIVESDFAAAIQEYGGGVWGEIVVSTGTTPSTDGPDFLYAYGKFKNSWTLGCRLHGTAPICAAFNTSGTRIYETPFHEPTGGAQLWDESGRWSEAGKAATRTCSGTDADLNCRDRWRLEISKNLVIVYANGVELGRYGGFPADAQVPDSVLNGDVYAYFASVALKPGSPTVRYHWDRVAVNPPGGPTSATGEVHDHGTTPTVTPTVKPTATPTPSTSGLKAEYFDNKDLTNLKLTRTDSQVNFNWWWGGPASGFGADTFSARWTGFVTVPKTELYTFHVTSDDGARLWVDNKLIMNRWFDHSSREYRGSIQLEAGKKYPIKLEYFENRGTARTELRWSSTSLQKQLVPSSALSN